MATPKTIRYDLAESPGVGLSVPDVYIQAYNGGHRDGIRAAAKLLADDYSDRADLLTGDARQAMRDAATIATNMATGAPAGSAPARGEWPIKRQHREVRPL